MRLDEHLTACVEEKYILEAGYLPTWTPGEPEEAGWYLVTYLSKDDPPCEAVGYLWFNPQTSKKWYIGTAGKTTPFFKIVVAYMSKPAPFKILLGNDPS